MTRHSDFQLTGAARILVCLRWGIGDLVMELPLLQAVRRAVPDACITALGSAPAIDLLAGERCVDQLVSVQDLGFAHWGDAGDERARRRLLEWCRERRFDCILEGSHAARGVQLALRASGLPWLDSGERPARGREADGVALLAQAAREAWGVEVPAVRPQLTLRPAEVEAAERLRRSLTGEGPVLALGAMASSPLKRGAPAEFARAADLLVARHGCRVLVFSGPGHDDGRDVCQAMAGTAPTLVEPMSLRHTAALLAQSRALICNDTGLLHLAAAVGVSVVGIYACTSPQLYLPPGGTAVWRWQEPCALLEASAGRFGVTPCVGAGRCLRSGHRRVERWADAAAAAASVVMMAG